MKLSVLAIFIALWVSVLAAAWGNDYQGGDNDDDHNHCHHHRGDDGNDHQDCNHQTGHATPVFGRTLSGTPYPPSPRANEPDDDKPGSVVPNPRGPIIPSSPPVNFTFMGVGNNGTNPPISRAKRQSCGGSGIVFDTSTAFDSDTNIGFNGSPAEPSGAKSGNVIFSTSNWIAAISTNGGATFNVIDPTVYAGPANPATDGGFCCDQVVQYLPSIDRFVWLLQVGISRANCPWTGGAKEFENCTSSLTSMSEKK